MIFKKIKIENFGCIKNMDFNFSDGFQIIYGENEAGKSTFSEFLKLMLYGKKDGNSKNSIRSKRIPSWFGGQTRGVLEFEDEGKIYILTKIFSEKACEDKIVCFNSSDNEMLKIEKTREIGEKFLNIGENEYEKSGYISSLGDEVFICSSKTNKKMGIKDIIINLMESGDKVISKKSAENKLQEAKKDLINSKGGGKINELRKEINDLESEKIILQRAFDENREIECKINKISELIDKVQIKKEKIKHMENIFTRERLYKLKKLLISYDDIKNKISDKFGINYDLAEKLQNECQELLIKIEKEEEKIKDYKKNLEKCVDIDDNYIKEVEKLESKHNEICNKTLEFEKLLVQIKNFNEKNSRILGKDCNILDDYKEIYEKIKKIELETNLSFNKIQDNNFFSEENLSNLKTNYKRFRNISIFLAAISLVLILFYFYNIFSLGILPLILSLGLFFFTAFKTVSLKNKKNIISKAIILKNLYSKINIFDEIIAEEKFYKSMVNKLINDVFLEDKLCDDIFSLKELENLKKEFYIKKNLSYKSLNDKLLEKSCIDVNDCRQKYANYSNCLYILEENIKSLDKKKHNLSELIFKYTRKDVPKLFSVGYVKEISDFVSKGNGILKGIKNLQENLETIEDINEIEDRINTLESKIKENENKFPDEFDYKIYKTLKEECESFDEIKMNKEKNDLIRSLKDANYDSLILIDEKIKKLKNKLETEKIYYESLDLALNVLDESYIEMKDKIAPSINAKMSDIFSKITSGRYREISIKPEIGVIYFKTSQCIFEYNKFSLGTIDQAYLSLRLAISEKMSENKKIPILMDDIMSRYDKKRLIETLKYLKDYSKINNLQIIMFTCHEYILKISEELGINYKKI